MNTHKFEINGIEVQQQFNEEGAVEYFGEFYKRYKVNRIFTNEKTFNRYRRFVTYLNKKKYFVEEKFVNGIKLKVEKKVISVLFRMRKREPIADLIREIEILKQCKNDLQREANKNNTDVSQQEVNLIFNELMLIHKEVEQKYSSDYYKLAKDEIDKGIKELREWVKNKIKN